MTDSPEETISSPEVKQFNAKLYRGEAPSSNIAPPRHSSDKRLLAEILNAGANPHDEGYADALLWVTPDEKYAKNVAMVRFLLKYSSNEEYRDRVMTQGDGFPRIVVYNADSRSTAYDATGPQLGQINDSLELPSQIVIDQIPEASVSVKELEPQSRVRLLSLADSRGMSETIYRACLYVDKVAGTHIVEALPPEQLDAMSLADGLKSVSDFYTRRGISPSSIEEYLGRGLFGYSMYMSDIAKNQMHFS